MKVSTLLKQAAKCKTEQELNLLYFALQDAFTENTKLSQLTLANAEQYMEGENPYVRFELDKQLSGYYITCIAPEIRDKKLTVTVVLNYMSDGYGMESNNWDIADGFEEELIEAQPNQTVAQLIKQAIQHAVDFQVTLLERVGVTGKPAIAAVKASFKA